jgi:hypothetical protein
MNHIQHSPRISSASIAITALMVVIPVLAILCLLFFVGRIDDDLWNGAALGTAALSCSAAFVVLWVAIFEQRRHS